MGLFKTKRQPITTQPNKLPAGCNDGTLAQISILRRQGAKNKRGQFIPAGWDLIDTYSQQVIAEYNDETAPPPQYLLRNRTGHGRITGRDFENGSELPELFSAIYTLCYNTTMDAMQMIAETMPEHKHSADGQPIAQLTFSAGVYRGKNSELSTHGDPF
jgi:hypothetical protein